MSTFNSSIYLYCKFKQQSNKSVSIIQQYFNKPKNHVNLLNKNKIACASSLQTDHPIKMQNKSKEFHQSSIFSHMIIKNAVQAKFKYRQQSQQISNEANFQESNLLVLQPTKKSINLRRKSLKSFLGEFVPKLNGSMQIKQNLQQILKRSIGAIKSQGVNNVKLSRQTQIKRKQVVNTKYFSRDQQNKQKNQVKYDDKKYKYNKSSKTIDNKQEINLYRLYNSITRHNSYNNHDQLTFVNNSKLLNKSLKIMPHSSGQATHKTIRFKQRKFNWIKLSKKPSFQFINFSR